jgi:hypothetical protein
VREEKARQPLSVGSTYVSQITCVDDVVHAGKSRCRRRARGYASVPYGLMAALQIRHGKGKNLMSPKQIELAAIC